MGIIIKTNNLHKEYRDICAVNNLNLSIKSNEIYALLGVNGVGKTTTIKMISCLTKPTSGDAIVNGFNILEDQDKIKQIINISPQETAIAPNLSVKENLEFILKLYEPKNNNAEIKINEVLSNFNLLGVSNKKSKNLSGGMKRRLSIAMALITNPQILFLDEPSLGLDVISRRELWNTIKMLKKKMTIILTTHYMEEAEFLADRVGIMSNGNLIFDDTPTNIIKKTKCSNFEDAFIKIAKNEVQL